MEPSSVPSSASVEASRAYLEAALDCVGMADAAGRVVEFTRGSRATVLQPAVLLTSAEQRQEQEEDVEDVEEDRGGEQWRRADVFGAA